MYWPTTANNAVKVEEVSSSEIILHMADGVKWCYNSIDKSIRRIGYIDRNKVAEEDLDAELWKKEFADRLRIRMRDKNITQSELSELTGIPQPYLSRYLRADVVPKPFAIRTIAKALGCSSSDLMDF
jgi:hypothetical protein